MVYSELLTLSCRFNFCLECGRGKFGSDILAGRGHSKDCATGAAYRKVMRKYFSGTTQKKREKLPKKKRKRPSQPVLGPAS